MKGLILALAAVPFSAYLMGLRMRAIPSELAWMWLALRAPAVFWGRLPRVARNSFR